MRTSTAVAQSPQEIDSQPHQIDPRQAEPRQIEAQWTVVECCPACGEVAGTVCGTLPDRYYVFGTERIALPSAGITVISCGSCGLVYKSRVPTPTFLAGVFERQTGAKWVGTHDFSVEAALLQKLAGKNEFDLLDVGATDGALLQACFDSGVTGRRSALDVLRYPGIEAHLAGEFIEGFVDAPSLTWSHQPYDIVTLFDVLEHLYQPRVAFENLRSLVTQGGLVFIETGNTQNFWPRYFGINQWWYIRLIEHHIFWSRRSLENIAAAHGFEIVFWEEGRHKNRRKVFRRQLVIELLKTGLYFVMANYYGAIAHMIGRQGSQPWCPLAKDHFRVCLKKW
jgi:2-polyprenyl-3-methyl-5-hydroxy-6-metoxy-1,4-benzoquinol methylase